MRQIEVKGQGHDQVKCCTCISNITLDEDWLVAGWVTVGTVSTGGVHVHGSFLSLSLSIFVKNTFSIYRGLRVRMDRPAYSIPPAPPQPSAPHNNKYLHTPMTVVIFAFLSSGVNKCDWW